MDEALQLALAAAEEASHAIRTRLSSAGLPLAAARAKGGDGDVVTELDEAAEAAIIHRLREGSPGVPITSEEAGAETSPGHGEGRGDGDVREWRWLVDPLDGTNNLVVGLPLVAVSIALVVDGEPRVGVVRDIVAGSVTTAVAGRGAHRDGRALSLGPPPPMERATVSWIQGHAVADADAATAVRRRLEDRCRRVLTTWAPALDWSLLASGGTSGLVLVDSEPEDLAAGLLCAREAGAAVLDADGGEVRAVGQADRLVAAHPELAPVLVPLVAA
ncbi:inositol monophosphatase family protein [Egibacter rhizosphaerae]|uniref:inositol monophosphatase family protein n=1 Tax=Egibacter rhizosphaerae TaxID=1670831 RepID=UPI0013F17E68|nr:inositol monophosphatase [Egibacter rhizosphaerae]